MTLSRGRVHLLGALILALVGTSACEDVTSPTGVDWEAFDAADPPIVPRTLLVMEGDLVAVGVGDFRPNLDVISWDWRSWHGRGGGLHVHEARAAAIFDDEIVIGGEADPAAGDSMSLAVERASIWRALAGDVDGPVYALAPLGPSLVVGGAFTATGARGTANIARWNGTAWSPLGAGIDGPVRILHAHGDSLYVVGDFTTAGGIAVEGVALYAGDTWSSLGDLPDGTVTAITTWDGDPVLGGAFEVATARDTVAFSVAVRDEDAWLPLGDLDIPGGVRSLAVFDGDLVAAGSTGVDRWTDGEWHRIHTSQGGTNALVVYRRTLIFGDGAGIGSSITRCKPCGTE